MKSSDSMLDMAAGRVLRQCAFTLLVAPLHGSALSYSDVMLTQSFESTPGIFQLHRVKFGSWFPPSAALIPVVAFKTWSKLVR